MTRIRKVADILRDSVSGFYTEEIRDAKQQRTGLRVVTLDGKRGELAGKMSGRGPRVGTYAERIPDIYPGSLTGL